MMEFTVYSKLECPYCYKVTQALELCGKSYKVYTLDEDFTREEFFSEFGKGSTFPQVVYDDIHLGGCRETISFLKENY